MGSQICSHVCWEFALRLGGCVHVLCVVANLSTRNGVSNRKDILQVFPDH